MFFRRINLVLRVNLALEVLKLVGKWFGGVKKL
jgi:hypothetical protein